MRRHLFHNRGNRGLSVGCQRKTRFKFFLFGRLKKGRVAKNPTKRGVAQGRSRIRGAREAITEYRVLRGREEYSLVELKPKTGRMHQLRVHMKAIGHPIACDKLYGGKNVCCPKGAGRQLLHAKSISFSFPAGRTLHFETDPPKDFEVTC